MYIRALPAGLIIGDGYQDYEGFEVKKFNFFKQENIHMSL
jgi:hypothetical protein